MLNNMVEWWYMCMLFGLCSCVYLMIWLNGGICVCYLVYVVVYIK